MSNRWDPASSTENRTSGFGGKPGDILSHLTSRIAVQKRIQATQQHVEGAAVYALRLPLPSPTAPPRSLPPQIAAELKAHLAVLRASSTSRLILIARLLPETGIADAESAVTACLRDMTLLQLANDRELEISEIMNMLNSVGDSVGRLVLVSKQRARNNATVTFEVRYQAYVDSHEL